MVLRPAPARAARLVAALCAGLGACALAGAEPTRPTDDQAVVATVPVLSAAERASRAVPPADLPEALARARAAIVRAQASGDPRDLGLAQAALGRWWTAASPPPEVRLLRASVQQSLHDFEAAKADLDALLQPPGGGPTAVTAQARLSRAGIHQLLGQLEAARADCQGLAALELPVWSWTAQVCLAELDSLTGRSAEAARALARLAPQAPAGQAGWLALVRAELAQRRDDPAAGALYAQSAQAAPGAYVLAAWADWLIEQGREDEVLSLLAGQDTHDGLLLRRAIALHRRADPEAAAAHRQLQERFAAALMRGEDAHLRERARAALDLDRSPAEALKLAHRQWALQKEPADARLLSRAAHAAGRPELARETDRLLRKWREEARTDPQEARR